MPTIEPWPGTIRIGLKFEISFHLNRNRKWTWIVDFLSTNLMSEFGFVEYLLMLIYIFQSRHSFSSCSKIARIFLSWLTFRFYEANLDDWGTTSNKKPCIFVKRIRFNFPNVIHSMNHFWLKDRSLKHHLYCASQKDLINNPVKIRLNGRVSLSAVVFGFVMMSFFDCY